MRTIIKSCSGISELDAEAFLSSRRILFLEGMIDQANAMALAKSLIYFQQEDDVRPVKLIINSPGGEVGAGMLLYDAIQTAAMPVKLYCFGMAFSMAAVIFAAGPHGRYLLPHSRLMIHEPVIPCGAGGRASSVQSMAHEMMKTREDMVKLLSRHTGQSVRKLSQLVRRDTFFTAQEAVDFGLADRVVSFREAIEEGNE